MPEDEKQPFDWKQWLSKQGFISVLLVAVLYVVRSDMLLPMVRSLQEVSDSMQKIEEGQDKLIDVQRQIRDEQRSGIWRSTDPPPPSEVPKAGP